MTDKEIADAARAYVKAREVMRAKSTDQTCRAADLAFDRLVAAVESFESQCRAVDRLAVNTNVLDTLIERFQDPRITDWECP